MGTAVEVLLVLLLIVANGLFSMPETAVVSVRKATRAGNRERGRPGAHTGGRALTGARGRRRI